MTILCLGFETPPIGLDCSFYPSVVMIAKDSGHVLAPAPMYFWFQVLLVQTCGDPRQHCIETALQLLQYWSIWYLLCMQGANSSFTPFADS